MSEPLQIPVSRITIHNPVSCHYECIESVIHYLPFICKERYEQEIKPNLGTISLVLNIVPETGFIKYITTYKTQLMNRYGFADIIINPVADVGYIEKPDIARIVNHPEPGEIRVFLTIPGVEFAKPEIFNWPNTYYILHNYRHRARALESNITPGNVFYLAPHCHEVLPNNYFIPDILPFSHKSVSYMDRPTQVPIQDGAWILVQGRLTRRVPALIKLLIKFSIASTQGQGQGQGQGQSPRPPPVNLVILTKSSNFILHNPANIHLITNSDFWDFHQWSAKCNIIATLVSPQTHHVYYTSKLTSSISYGLAYQMRFLIDTDLYNVYSHVLQVADEQQNQQQLQNCFTYATRQDFIKVLKEICY